MRIMINNINETNDVSQEQDEIISQIDAIDGTFDDELDDVVIDDGEERQEAASTEAVRVQDIPSNESDDSIPAQQEDVDDSCDNSARESVEETHTEEEYKQLKEAYSSLQDRYERMMNDWDAYRTRTAREAEQSRSTANENIVKALLPTLDNFDRAINHALETGGEEVEPYIEGFQAIQRVLLSALAKEGVTMIVPIGEPFDIHNHQAVERVDKDKYGVEPDVVVRVLQPGFLLNDKLVRPAVVSVSA